LESLIGLVESLKSEDVAEKTRRSAVHWSQYALATEQYLETNYSKIMGL
jgi:hypothetical protein